MGRVKHSVEQIINKMRDELLNGEVFDTLDEAKVLAEKWRMHYNCFRPHSSHTNFGSCYAEPHNVYT